jgi:APA family basic amino acid/polyamine antiporter
MNLIALGIGAIIGTGIFVLTGQAAAANAGPGIVISMLIAGGVSTLAALCYAEFASSVPVAGSAYTYAYATLGELIAWAIGWDLILEYALGAATVAVGWSGNVVSLLGDMGIRIPAAISAAPGTIVTLADGTTATAVFNLPAVLISLLVTWLLVRGVQESATVNAVVVVIKVAIILLIIAAGLPSSIAITSRRSFRRTPARSANSAGRVSCGVRPSSSSPTSALTRSRPPRRRRDIRSATCLAASWARWPVCTILYVAVSAVMIGLVPYGDLGGPAPMAVAIDHARTAAAGSSWEAVMRLLAPLVKIGIVAGLTSTMVVQMMAQPRIFMSMAQDGLLPAWAGASTASTGHRIFTTMLRASLSRSHPASRRSACLGVS